MATCQIHQVDAGTLFEVTLSDCGTLLDVSGATTKQIIFKKPDGTTLTTTASFKTDGTDGIIQYTTTITDLDQSGIWSIQAYIVIGTSQWHTDIQTFRVYGNLT